MKQSIDSIAVEFDDAPRVDPIIHVDDKRHSMLRYVLLIQPTGDILQRSPIPDNSLVAANIRFDTWYRHSYDLNYSSRASPDFPEFRRKHPPKMHLRSQDPHDINDFQFALKTIMQATRSSADENHPLHDGDTIYNSLSLPRKPSQDTLAFHIKEFTNHFNNISCEFVAYWNVPYLSLVGLHAIMEENEKNSPKSQTKIYVSADNQEDLELLTPEVLRSIPKRPSTRNALQEYKRKK